MTMGFSGLLGLSGVGGSTPFVDLPSCALGGILITVGLPQVIETNAVAYPTGTITTAAVNYPTGIIEATVVESPTTLSPCKIP